MQIREGEVLNGKITGITAFGAFVELEGGKSGMIHISEVSSEYVKDISEHLAVGDEVRVKVLSVNEQGKISLSIKQLELEEGKEEKSAPVKKPQKKQERAPIVWQGRKPSNPPGEKQTFEEMMASFKKASEEKISDLKRNENKRGSAGYSRRGKG